ncbi:MAG: CoA-binding protein, partial [Bartonella sp.]|nr:CoA-binding protein [Bartonella sp.]
PALKDKTIQNIKVYGSLSDITQTIDMIDVFRKSEAVREILDETLNLSIRPLVFWTQIGVYDGDAARIAADNGMYVVMNKCPKIELLQ